MQEMDNFSYCPQAVDGARGLSVYYLSRDMYTDMILNSLWLCCYCWYAIEG